VGSTTAVAVVPVVEEGEAVVAGGGVVPVPHQVQSGARKGTLGILLAPVQASLL